MTPRPVSVATARLERTAAGTPYSADFSDIYHASEGGLAQARHVFLAGNDLPGRWRARETFTILETGFGIGLNFLAAWHAWRDDAARPKRLHFVSVEKRPFARDDLERALAPFAELDALARALARAWPPPIAGFHRLHFEGGRVMLTLILGDAREAMPQVEASADALFLDGFAPARNPAMWSPEVVRELARIAAPGATLATWTVAGGVRAALSGAGFRVEKRPGFGAKREMLVGVREGAANLPPVDRRALVVGAGIAGTLCGAGLARRGWDVTLLDERPRVAVATAGIMRPIANVRDALNAQLSRGAFLHALQHFANLERDGYPLGWNRCGVLQLAKDADDEARFEAIARSLEYPAAFLEYVDAVRAASIAGRRVDRGGWWIPHGCVVSVASLIVASHAAGSPGLREIRGRRVERIERADGEWRAHDASGDSLAQAPVIVVANAADAARLVPEAKLALSAVRGQVTFLPPGGARRLEVVVSGNGYIAPMPEGGHTIGATYGHDDFDAAVRRADHLENLARAESMVPGFTAGIEVATLEGRTGFRTTVPDRLPVYGAIGDQGLFVATGLGSRGLLWAPIGAELLACRLESEPLPVPRDFAGALSPQRFR